MNLPIKLVDLVTLLFLSLLVVIIVFIILQRNIKRFKLRNVKDPHFLACKSIPKGLKELIIRKHNKSHAYSEAPCLITSTYQDLPEDNTKMFITRMKAFEVSKNLEYALAEAGAKRSMALKFEEFIETLINSDKNPIPKGLLREFNDYYVWAMLDPMVFGKEQLKNLYRIINTIIEQLAINNKDSGNQIIQYRLDLDQDGNYDFTKRFNAINQQGSANNNQSSATKSKQHSKEKQPKSYPFSSMSFDMQPSTSNADKSIYNSFIASSNTNNNNNNTENNSSKNKNKDSKNQSSRLGKGIFSRKLSVDKSVHSSSSSLAKENRLKDKLKGGSTSKYEEIKDTSFDSNTQSMLITQTTINANTGSNSGSLHPNDGLNSPKPLLSVDQESDDIDQTNRWSTNNDSIKVFDSENEEIPLVAKNTKTPSHNNSKKKNHSGVLSSMPINSILNNQTSTNNKEATSLLSSINTESATSNNMQLNILNTNISNSDAGAENQGFNNKTFETNI